MGRSSRSRWVLLLALAGGLSIGAPCDSGQRKARVYVDPPSVVVPPGTLLDLDVMMDVTSGQVQAFEISTRADPSLLALVSIEPAEFDDDGGFFLPPSYDFGAGTVSAVVDLRHGSGSAVSGLVRVARLRVVALSSGVAEVDVTQAALADPGGAAFTVETDDSRVTIAP